MRKQCPCVGNVCHLLYHRVALLKHNKFIRMLEKDEVVFIIDVKRNIDSYHFVVVLLVNEQTYDAFIDEDLIEVIAQ
jgi:hypothetical protein